MGRADDQSRQFNFQERSLFKHIVKDIESSTTVLTAVTSKERWETEVRKGSFHLYTVLF